MSDASRVTRTTVRDHAGPGGTIAVVTLDNPAGRPVTLGVPGLTALRETLLAQRERAAGNEIHGLVVTGTPGSFCAGADLDALTGVRDRADALDLARLGHATLRLLGELGVPTFAVITGPALGGGLELALHADHRTVGADVRALGLPETVLGLVPGWGGCYLLPRLVGVREAARLVLDNPWQGNRFTDAATAAEIGLVDVVVPADDVLDASLAWAHEVIAGRLAVDRRPLDDEQTWRADVAAAGARLDRRLHGAVPAPPRALALLAAARDAEPDAAFAAEDDALADLMLTDEVRAGRYALTLTTGRARRPVGAPDPSVARPVREVGVVGAGLMATQLAVLLAARLDVPVHLRELDVDRAAAGRARIADLVERQARRAGWDTARSAHLAGLLQVGTDLADLAGADLVIEAVTEVAEVKRAVFAEVEALVGERTVLATNTSALSVSAMAAGLRHPERVVGLHFFNPVAQLPLVEVVRAAATDEATLATAVAVAQAAGKTAVVVADRPGFVVNRLLLRELALVLHAVQTGTPVEVADRALDPLALPMSPFALLQLVGLPVAQHVLATLHTELGDRYPLSPGLAALAAQGRSVVGAGGDRVDPAVQDAFGPPGGPGARDESEVLDLVLDGLAEEVGLMLAERVVQEPEQIDLCLILGAGFGFHLGGLLPYLERTGRLPARQP